MSYITSSTLTTNSTGNSTNINKILNIDDNGNIEDKDKDKDEDKKDKDKGLDPISIGLISLGAIVVAGILGAIGYTIYEHYQYKKNRRKSKVN